MMYILFIGIIISAFITVINSMACYDGWLAYDGKCLKHYSTLIPWTGANASCFILRRALLATVDSQEINSFVQNNVSSDPWIGLSIPDISKSSWKWSDGGNISSYDGWNMADVDSACAVMKYDNTGSERYWHTKPCTNTNSYVCEKEMGDDNCSDWLNFDTQCYLIINEPSDTNMAAARNCWQYDAYLISINNQQEAAFIYSTLRKGRVYWIGLSPLRWVNDEPYQWNNWGINGPSITDRCVYINATSGKWHSGSCENILESLHSYICQRDMYFPVTMVDKQTPTVVKAADTSAAILFGESYTTEFDTLTISNTQSSTVNSYQHLLTAVIPAVCGGLVAVIVIIVVVIVVRRQRRRVLNKHGMSVHTDDCYTVGVNNARLSRRSSSQDAKSNDIKNTTEHGKAKKRDLGPIKMNEPNKYGPAIDSKTSSVDDTSSSTYEQLSQGPYVNSGQITPGTYASLQNNQTKAPKKLSVVESGGSTYEQLSKDPYVNSGHVTAGTYASLQ